MLNNEVYALSVLYLSYTQPQNIFLCLQMLQFFLFLRQWKVIVYILQVSFDLDHADVKFTLLKWRKLWRVFCTRLSSDFLSHFVSYSSLDKSFKVNVCVIGQLAKKSQLISRSIFPCGIFLNLFTRKIVYLGCFVFLRNKIPLNK